MAAVKCPHCGLYNPSDAERCDCGYALSPSMGRARVSGIASVSLVASEVTVVDIKMPFGSMVAFMVKWALASIPAFLILLLLGVVATAAFSTALAAAFHFAK